MGVRTQVQVDSRLYTVVADLEISWSAVITGALVDEVTGAPLAADATITPDLPGLVVKMADGGLFAVAAYVDLALPNLGTTAYTVKLHLSAPGYRPADVSVPIPAGSVLPIAYPAIRMRLLPVRLQGRIVKASDRSPIANAAVRSAAASVLLIRSPLAFDHAAGVAVNAFTFTPTGPALTLAAAAPGGSNSVFLSSAAGLAAGQVLRIGDDPLVEIAIIQSLGPDPAQVNLQTRLNSTFPLHAPARQAIAAAAAGSATLARDSNAGDGLLLLSGPLAATGVQVADGTATEYHLLNAVADASGYYHVNGVAGVASLHLQAEAAGFSNAPATWFPVYNDPVNVVDFRLKP
jgi:hypothetical protein